MNMGEVSLAGVRPGAAWLFPSNVGGFSDDPGKPVTGYHVAAKASPE
jgi:hypothetical protein